MSDKKIIESISFDGVSDMYTLRVLVDGCVHEVHISIGFLSERLIAVGLNQSQNINLRGGVTIDAYDVEFFESETGVNLPPEVVSALNDVIKRIWRNQTLSVVC